MANHHKKHKHRRRSFIGQFIHDIRKKLSSGKEETESIDDLFNPSRMKEYHTSHSHSIDDYVKETGSEPEKEHRHHRKHKKSKPSRNYIREFAKNIESWWNRAKHNRRKEKFKRKMRRKQRQELRKDRMQEFIRSFLPNYKKESISTEIIEHDTGSEKHPVSHYYLYAINSTCLYIIAYMSVYLIYQFTVLFSASLWGLDSVLFYYDLTFNDYSPLWTRLNIITITFSGPLISLVIGVLFFRFFARHSKVKGYLRLFFIWVSLHGLNFFFGAFSSGVSFDEGFGYVANWLYMNVFWQILLSLIFLFMLGIFGYYTTSRFLETSNSTYRIRRENRFRFLLSQAFAPWILGSLLIYLIKIPNNLPYDVGNMITMVFAVLPVLFNRKGRPEINFEREKKRHTTINWASVIVFLIIASLFRIGLNSGLHFMINIKFSVSITPL